MEIASFDGYVVDTERLLRSVARIVRKRGRDILAAFEITPPQLDALLHLRESGDLTMGELCQKMYLACSTATDLSDRMERTGLIVRQRDTTDRRVVRLHITERGDDIISQVMQARREYLRTIVTKMDDDDKQRLIDALGQIHTLMTDERVK
ncbi:MAG TPA: transcriptional regulator [Clostridiales bacterium UBA8153]|nr:transcriptional regulator [Clostridiales bacterium UBA8153]